ncbi:PREDICTED: vitrin-like [Branchiostoma belcheri]|uniref:Vitrin-like n=1 Tax=Branchiostoma belcheri TaxID=7741 RepID=A0A6P5AYG3_BRABE|nr:PREDICTED: vitrin-like [Branchiostoma belcheri]
MFGFVATWFAVLSVHVFLSAADLDEPAISISCDTSAEGLQNDISSFVCPRDCVSSSTADVWGTGIYRDLSSICKAAVHDGKIADVRGGQVVVVRQPASTSFTGSLQNGVTSKSHTHEDGGFSWSFSFRKVFETPIMCPDPPTYEDAHVYSGSSPYFYGDQVSYVCDGDTTDNPETGEGPFVLVCGLNGTWKGDKPLCTDNGQPSPSTKTSVGTIVGVVIAVFVVLIVVLTAAIIITRRR